MILSFGPFTLDPDRAELRGPEGAVPIEPKALGLLCLLATNADRVIPKDEMIEKLWGGRFVSDAAVATAIRQVRQALGDDAESQTYLRTLRGLGHRFVAPVTLAAAARPASAEPAAPSPPSTGRPPTLAVLPFEADRSGRGTLAQAIPAEIISSLSRLRWLRVIARESCFRFAPGAAPPETVRKVLGADYLLTGRIDTPGPRLAVSVDLVETEGATLVWSDRFEARLDDIHPLRERITATILAALDLRIPLAEAARARLKPVEHLDAWAAFHLGLSHMYRFNRADNAAAAALFTRALSMDPGLAPVWAARSFTQYQMAIMGYDPDRASAVARALHDAERALDLDPLDPQANYAFGRAQNLMGRPADGLPWLDQSIQLSPSFAKAHYSRAMLNLLTDRFGPAAADVGLSMELSPLDPLLTNMRSMHSLALAARGDIARAVEVAELAARTSQGHFINILGSVVIFQMAGRDDLVRHWAPRVREIRPDASARNYLTAMPFPDRGLGAEIRHALAAAGFA